MIQLAPDITKKFILERISQEEIFEKYLGESVSYTDRICSPLREDSSPTCTFKKYSSGVVWFKDWAGHFAGDCFSLVQRMYGVNYPTALEIIARDFRLVNGVQLGSKHKRKPKLKNDEKIQETAEIRVQWRNYDDSDMCYWRSHGIITSTLCKYHIGAVRNAWVNGKVCYSQLKTDPCYGYYFGKGLYKLYFPSRKEFRFLGNYKGLQGYAQLPKTGKLLIVTKSLKDVMFLHQMGIASVAPASESSILTEEEYTELKTRFDELICLYDFDLTGVRSSNKMRKQYNIQPIFLTNGRFKTIDYEGKDITDIAKNISSEQAIDTIKKLLNGRK